MKLTLEKAQNNKVEINEAKVSDVSIVSWVYPKTSKDIAYAEDIAHKIFNILIETKKKIEEVLNERDIPNDR